MAHGLPALAAALAVFATGARAETPPASAPATPRTAVAPTAAGASAAARAPACAASAASAAARPRRATSKLRHIPDENDPCADSKGLGAPAGERARP